MHVHVYLHTHTHMHTHMRTHAHMRTRFALAAARLVRRDARLLVPLLQRVALRGAAAHRHGGRLRSGRAGHAARRRPSPLTTGPTPSPDPCPSRGREQVKLRDDVARRGLSLVVLAEWHHPAVLSSVRFFDENTHAWMEPVTGGANLPALNELLGPLGVAFGSRVLPGDRTPILTLATRHLPPTTPHVPLRWCAASCVTMGASRPSPLARPSRGSRRAAGCCACRRCTTRRLRSRRRSAG